jgi:heptaprenylglyceryl phosphate synthase
MAIENLKPIPTTSVEVSSDVVFINGFQTSEPDVVRLFNEDPERDPEELLEKLLRLGTETFRIMGTTATSEILENVANEVRSGMELKKIEIVSDMESRQSPSPD